MGLGRLLVGRRLLIVLLLMLLLLLLLLHEMLELPTHVRGPRREPRVHALLPGRIRALTKASLAMIRVQAF